MTGPDPSPVRKSPRKAKKRSRDAPADSSQANTGKQKAKKNKQDISPRKAKRSRDAPADSSQANTGKQKAKKSKQNESPKKALKRSRDAPADSSQANTEKQEVKESKPEPYFWLQDLGLTMKDKMALEGTRGLNYRVLAAAAHLLKQQFRDATGLPCIRVVHFSVSPTTQPTLQFHLDIERQHAFVSACDGTKVVVADCSSVNPLGSMATQQIEISYKKYVKDPITNMEYLLVEQQASTDGDCVVRSIAMAYELLAADGNMACIYNKQLLRPHLIQCFINRKITEFPKDYKPAGQPSEKPFKWKP